MLHHGRSRKPWIGSTWCTKSRKATTDEGPIADRELQPGLGARLRGLPPGSSTTSTPASTRQGPDPHTLARHPDVAQHRLRHHPSLHRHAAHPLGRRLGRSPTAGAPGRLVPRADGVAPAGAAAVSTPKALKDRLPLVRWTPTEARRFVYGRELQSMVETFGSVPVIAQIAPLLTTGGRGWRNRTTCRRRSTGCAASTPAAATCRSWCRWSRLYALLDGDGAPWTTWCCSSATEAAAEGRAGRRPAAGGRPGAGW